jgi:hypothetical protein
MTSTTTTQSLHNGERKDEEAEEIFCITTTAPVPVAMDDRQRGQQRGAVFGNSGGTGQGSQDACHQEVVHLLQALRYSVGGSRSGHLLLDLIIARVNCLSGGPLPG